MFILFAISFPPSSIQLYLDPGSQGAIIQTLLAALLGISLFIRAFWRNINAFIAKIRGKPETTQTEDDAKDTDNTPENNK